MNWHQFDTQFGNYRALGFMLGLQIYQFPYHVLHVGVKLIFNPALAGSTIL